MVTKQELQKEKDFIILRSSNYHYDLGAEHERERIIKEIKSKLLTKGRRPNRIYIKEVLNSF